MSTNNLPIWNGDQEAAQRFVDQALADLTESDAPHALLQQLFARVWQQGWDLCYEDGGEDWNPYTGQQVQL